MPPNLFENEAKEIPSPPSFNGHSNGSNGGREQLLPDMLGGNRGIRDMNLEEYNALKETLTPGTGKDLDARTELSADQIAVFAAGRRVASHYGIEELDLLLDDIARLSISKNRKSRKEFVQAITAQAQADERSNGILGKLSQ